MYIGNAKITAVSDERLKTDIHPSSICALAAIRAFNIVDHQWNDPSDKSDEKNSRGRWKANLVAQDIAQSVPWAVQKAPEECFEISESGSVKGAWRIDSIPMIAVLAKAIQELDEKKACK